MDMKKVKINRHSVCAAEDVISHTITLESPENITFMEIFNKLIDERYFPSMTDVAWVLTYENKDYIAWLTKQNVFIPHYSEDDMHFNANSNEEIFFRYICTSDKKRSKYNYD